MRVVAQAADEWPGEAKVSDDIEAMRVVIENNGDQTLLIRYRGFRLV